MKVLFTTLFALALAAGPTLSSAAEPMEVVGNDTVRTVLAKYKGKTITVRLKDGGEMTGKVQSVGNFTVHLGALAGKEYFDATVDLGEINAVVARTRDR